MKKFIYFLLIIHFTSCSNESQENSNDDQIIGKWQLFNSIEGGIDVTNNCLKKSEFTFTDNNKVNGEVIIENNNNCVSDDGVQTGSWSRNGTSNNYNIFFSSRSNILEITLINDHTFIANEDDVVTTYKKL